MFAKSLPARGRCRVGARVKSKLKRNCQRCPFGATAEQQNSRTAEQLPLRCHCCSRFSWTDTHTHTVGYLRVCVCVYNVLRLCLVKWIVYFDYKNMANVCTFDVSLSVCVCEHVCEPVCLCLSMCVCPSMCVRV